MVSLTHVHSKYFVKICSRSQPQIKKPVNVFVQCMYVCNNDKKNVFVVRNGRNVLRLDGSSFRLLEKLISSRKSTHIIGYDTTKADDVDPIVFAFSDHVQDIDQTMFINFLCNRRTIDENCQYQWRSSFFSCFHSLMTTTKVQTWYTLQV